MFDKSCSELEIRRREIKLELNQMEARKCELNREWTILSKQLRERTPQPRDIKCTCHVVLCTGIDLPDCPRGLQNGNRYKTWADVPDKVIGYKQD